MEQNIGIFFGSTTGNTEDVASVIAEKLSPIKATLHDISTDGLHGLDQYSRLVFGIPTWDFGELQEDWLDLWPELEQLNLTGVQCAVFGLGDQIGYGEWFLDAMGLLYELLVSKGAVMCGHWPVEGYQFEASKALIADGREFVGLAIDEDGQHAETEERVERWCKQIVQEFNR